MAIGASLLYATVPSRSVRRGAPVSSFVRQPACVDAQTPPAGDGRMDVSMRSSTEVSTMSQADHAERSTAWLLRSSPDSVPSPMESQWGDQFRAVERTLGRIAAEMPVAVPPAAEREEVRDGASALLDCISTLGGLHDRAM